MDMTVADRSQLSGQISRLAPRCAYGRAELLDRVSSSQPATCEVEE